MASVGRDGVQGGTTGTVSAQSAYAHCQEITRAAAKNFYYAFITLPKPQRLAIYAVYAFCRLCDDIADEQLPLEQKVLLLGEVRGDLAGAYQGRVSGPVFTALADAVGKYHVPQQHLDDIVSGVEMDLTVVRYQTFEELCAYCYRVASAVGLICTRIFGGMDPTMEPLAADLGLAMQLTNIMRDIPEDAARGRIYVPLDELRRFGYTEQQLVAGEFNEAFVALMRFQAERARGYFASGMRLVPMLPWRSRACPAVLGRLYSRVLDRIEERGYNVFLGRMRLSSREKLLLALGIWLQIAVSSLRRAAA
ncbi:MAG: squalene synthase HpnD [Dehalococcoidia bacterium]|nr:squalene synthase HpnD [Dehalococcoidia bacterium]